MGLAPGGRMKQEIYEDSYGFDAWDRDHASRCFVTILNAAQWQAVTGELPPTEPVSAEQYEESRIPWFDWYAADQKPLAGAPTFKGVQSVVEMAKAKGDGALPITPPRSPRSDISAPTAAPCASRARFGKGGSKA
jgi:hypothetical protein